MFLSTNFIAQFDIFGVIVGQILPAPQWNRGTEQLITIGGCFVEENALMSFVLEKVVKFYNYNREKVQTRPSPL